MISKTAVTILAALLINSSTGIQMNKVLKERAQAGWRNEAYHKLDFVATSELSWAVLNSFYDVQTNPYGDVYAVQNVRPKDHQEKFYLYLYSVSNNTWNIFRAGLQAKQARFDILGNMYYLGVDDCVYRDSDQKKMACDVKDFEVTADGKLYIIVRDGSTAPNKNEFVTDPNNGVVFQRHSNVTALTLLRDKPIFIDLNHKAPAEYNSESLISISAGIDGALWGLQYEPNVTDYQIVKWQTAPENKWYKIGTARGVNLSAYNEISLALVTSEGLVSITSSEGNQDTAYYTDGTTYTPPVNGTSQNPNNPNPGN